MKASAPTTAGAMTTSSIMGGMAGGTPLATAAIKPLPLGEHLGGKGESHRASGAPVNHFQTPMPLPHMVHPQNNIGLPKGAIK